MSAAVLRILSLEAGRFKPEASMGFGPTRASIENSSDCSPPPAVLVPRPLALAASIISTMTLLNTNHYIPHTHSSFPVPYTSVIAPKPHELYSQQRTTADPRLSSFLRSAPAALAFPPAHHPEFLPCGALGVNVDISEPMPNYNPWCSTMSTPTRQVFSADVRMRNMEPREMTEPAYEHL